MENILFILYCELYYTFYFSDKTNTLKKLTQKTKSGDKKIFRPKQSVCSNLVFDFMLSKKPKELVKSYSE